MKRKEFVKASSLVIASGMITPFWSCSPEKPNEEYMKEIERSNWAGNYTYKAPHLHEPTTVEEVQSLVKSLDKQKALGSRHCFNNIADSPGNQISTKNLNKIVSLDGAGKKLTVQAGIRYGDFSVELHEKGYALHNLASLPHITVAGACSTATHGSGVSNGNLATAVSAIELVTPSGDLISLDRDHPDFYAVVVGLGAFGIITTLTLDIMDTFDVRQDVFQDLPLDSVKDHFNEIMSAGYSVSLFTDWQDEKISEVWVKRRMDHDPEDLGDNFYGARAASENLHPIISLSAESCSEQLGVPGPWFNRLPHFKMGFTPSAGEELQAEYFVPAENAVDAILAVEKMKDEIFPHLLISEIRTIAADEFWMSPCYRQNSVAIHFTWKDESREVMALLPTIEKELAPYAVRPHWGKLFQTDPGILRNRIEKFDDFVALAKTYDPEGKFRNQYLNENIY